MTGKFITLEPLLYNDMTPRAFVNGQWATYTDEFGVDVVAALMMNKWGRYSTVRAVVCDMPKQRDASLRNAMEIVDFLAPYTVEWFFRILSLDGQCDADYRAVWNGVRAQIEAIAPDCFRSLDWRFTLEMFTT